jgi:hypothetical protein
VKNPCAKNLVSTMVDVLDQIVAPALTDTQEKDAKKITVLDHVSPRSKTTCAETNCLESSVPDPRAVPPWVPHGASLANVVPPDATVHVASTATRRRRNASTSTSVAASPTSAPWVLASTPKAVTGASVDKVVSTIPQSSNVQIGTSVKVDNVYVSSVNVSISTALTNANVILEWC